MSNIPVSVHEHNNSSPLQPADITTTVPDTVTPSTTFRGQLPPADAFCLPRFPLTVNEVMDLCTRCWLPGQMLPLSQLTGEEAFFGFFHPTQLRTECLLLLPRPICITDWWEIRRAMYTFLANPHVFQCRSIFLALGYCEAYVRKLFGIGVSLAEEVDKEPTAIEAAEDFVAKHSQPQDTP